MNRLELAVTHGDLRQRWDVDALREGDEIDRAWDQYVARSDKMSEVGAGG